MPRLPVLTIFIVAVLALAALPVAAQDEADPGASDSAESSSSRVDVADLLPAEIGGVPAEISVIRGADLSALDPEDDAESIEQLTAFAAAVGGSVEGLTVAGASVFQDFTLSFFLGWQLAGADTDTLVSAYLELIAQPGRLYADGTGATVQEDIELAGRMVIRASSVDPQNEPYYVYGTGDMVWLLNGSSEDVAAFLATLPSSVADPCEPADALTTGVFETECRLDIVTAPGETLRLTRADLPVWARDRLITVGAVATCGWPPARATEGDPNVTLDGRPIVRIGDATSHGGTFAAGSDRIFINDRPAATVGAFQTCPMALPGPVPHVGGIVLGDPGHHVREVGVLLSPAGVGEIELDMDASDVVIGGYIYMQGILGSDLGLVKDKGSVILDRPLRFDYPAGTSVLAVPAEYEEAISAIYVAEGAETPPA